MLSVLGGVGLAAMPWKLINDFIHRERSPMTRSEYIRNCQNLRKRATELKVCFALRAIHLRSDRELLPPPPFLGFEFYWFQYSA